MASGAILFALVHCPARSATLSVGPGQQITSIARAARLAQDGDIVEIAAGTYAGDVAVWLQKSLTIRGLGAGPVLDAAGMSAEDKAIWVFRDGHFTIENIEFRNARVPAGNGAGIRFEHGHLTVSACVFRDNQMGILTSNDGRSELSIRDSQFIDAPKQESPLPHLIYVGRIARFEMQGTRIAGGHWGHLVKSRARVSDLRYNLIADPPDGSASYELDFPNGGDVTLIGNLIGQSASSENRTLVSFGAEGGQGRTHRLRMAFNTLVSEGFMPGTFWQIWRNRLGTAPTVAVHNNLLVGVGLAEHHPDNVESGNHYHPLPANRLMDWNSGNLCAPGADPRLATPAGTDLLPRRAFAWPRGSSALPPTLSPVAGALPCGTTPQAAP
ncbi:MAG: hypothetical protein KDH20_17380 [Rhodocyclaceae bacterium]|nr:hypothetical protein [Rhodocyclaceae bacterium]